MKNLVKILCARCTSESDLKNVYSHVKLEINLKNEITPLISRSRLMQDNVKNYDSSADRLIFTGHVCGSLILLLQKTFIFKSKLLL